MSSEDIKSLEMLSTVLSSGKSSRLYQKIVYDKKLAKSTSSFVWDNELGGLFIISSTGLKKTDLKILEDELTAETERFKSEPVTDFELEKSKNNSSDFVAQTVQFNNGERPNSLLITGLILKHRFSQHTCRRIFRNNRR